MAELLTYVTIDGELLDLTRLSEPERGFFDRCYEAWRSGMASWVDMGRLVGGGENPLIRPAGRVTRDIWNHPLYRAAADLEARVGLREERLRPEPGQDWMSDPIADEWLSARAAASAKGVALSTIHGAIERGLLVAAPRKPGGAWLGVSRRSLNRWQPMEVRQMAARRRHAVGLREKPANEERYVPDKAGVPRSRHHMKRLFVAGGAGFIGSNFVRHMLSKYPDLAIVNFDKLTYAGNLDNLRDVENDPRYRFVRGDIADPAAVRAAIEGCDAAINFAAESHVDRSLLEAGAFAKTDVLGTVVMLTTVRDLGLGRYLHVSTDEVYGDIPPGASSRESDPIHPRSPYAASKAGGDMQCLAFHESFGVPVIVTRASNNFGPYQHPEKALPLFISNAVDDQPLPLYGDGRNVRDWLFVEDHCTALDFLLHEGRPGEVYNIGGGNERENIDVLRQMLALLGKPETLIRFVADRPGHDRRYSLDSSKLRSLGWAPAAPFETRLAETVNWYRENRWWWERIKSGEYRQYYEQQYGWRLAGLPSQVTEG